jgi:thiol:disulfide interchange protein
MRGKFIAIAAVLIGASAFGQTAEEIVRWSAHGPTSARAGALISIELQADIQKGWHVYSISQMPGGPETTVISFPSKQPFRQDGLLQPPMVHKAFDPNFNMKTETYEGTVKFRIPVIVDAVALVGNQKIAVDVLFQTCNDTVCLPPFTQHLFVPLKILPGPGEAPPRSATSGRPSPLTSKTKEVASSESNQSAAPGAGSAPTATPPRSTATVSPSSETTAVTSRTFTSFLWFAMAMGALSLLTPCVFPMIPITVSYFTNHAGGSRRSAVFTAMVYGIGIILTFSALGMLMAVIFGAGGVNQLAANPWVNLFITFIFLGLAFSLFGAYFVQIPPRLMNKIDAITRSKEGSQIAGAILMGFTFTLTSFTCTAPFVGTLLVMTTQGNWHWPLAGMLAFSTVFATPFVVLALVPQILTRLPKSGGWMNSVKVVMGFLEIAAAMKFLSNADLVWRWGIFTRQVVLAVWVGIGVLTVLYVLGYFRMSHDSRVESIGAGRLSVAIFSLALTIWLIPGLFGRPLGELESFLPPDSSVGSSVSASGSAAALNLQSDASWILNDYQGGVTKARQENKLVFIDFTGYTCTNCRWMEANMFPRPEVSREIEKFVRVRLYTDGAGDLFERQQAMQQEKFGTVALPLYAIVRPDGSVVATFAGLTRNSNEFVTFLKRGLA